MEVVTRVDKSLRDLALLRIKEYRPVLGTVLAGEVIDSLLSRADPSLVRRKLTPAERENLSKELGAVHGERLALEPRFDEVTALVKDASKRLVALGVLEDRSDLLSPPPSPWERASDLAGEVLGKGRETLFTRITDRVVRVHEEKLKERMKSLNWELFDRAVAVGTEAAVDELVKRGEAKTLTLKAATSGELTALRPSLEKPFSDRLFLWQKSKQDLVDEMGTALQVPGWGNIFTQPIINRIEMLATGVRTPVGVKVFGDDLDEIQRVSQEIAEVLRGVRGANGVVPDQIVGKGYVEIDIDREKAARYGIQVGDIQDVVEVAMGGKPLTMTVEGRRRFPVRVRYARDFRTDEEALKHTLIAARGANRRRSRRPGRDGHGWVVRRRPPRGPPPSRLRSRSPRWRTSGWSRDPR